MKIIFTLCSNNYLAQAKTLINSIVKYADDYKIFIGLVDEKDSAIDYGFFNPAKVLTISELNFPDFEKNCQRYNLIELNTSVKPSFFKYLIDSFENVEKIFYFDPDTKLFSGLNHLESLLDVHEILLTPHIHRPIALDCLIPEENLFLNYGIFNLGFIGVCPGSPNVQGFLDWWEARCISKCLVHLEEGIFVDQLWINLVPYLFEKVHSLKEFGYNMGPWNVHERKICEFTNESLNLNDGSSLVFFHFSGYRFNEPEKISTDPYNRESLANRSDLMIIFSEYQSDLLKNKVEKFSKFECRLFIKKSG